MHLQGFTILNKLAPSIGAKALRVVLSFMIIGIALPMEALGQDTISGSDTEQSMNVVLLEDHENQTQQALQTNPQIDPSSEDQSNAEPNEGLNSSTTDEINSDNKQDNSAENANDENEDFENDADVFIATDIKDTEDSESTISKDSEASDNQTAETSIVISDESNNSQDITENGKPADECLTVCGVENDENAEETISTCSNENETINEEGNEEADAQLPIILVTRNGVTTLDPNEPLPEKYWEGYGWETHPIEYGERYDELDPFSPLVTPGTWQTIPLFDDTYGRWSSSYVTSPESLVTRISDATLKIKFNENVPEGYRVSMFIGSLGWGNHISDPDVGRSDEFGYGIFGSLRPSESKSTDYEIYLPINYKFSLPSGDDTLNVQRERLDLNSEHLIDGYGTINGGDYRGWKVRCYEMKKNHLYN